jgi:predicted double-glycine peptidase
VVRQQWELSCGAAAIATLFTYQLGRPVSERQVALAMLRGANPQLVRARLGFSLLDLNLFAATHGFAAAGFAELELADLDRMAPLIVPITWHGRRSWRWPTASARTRSPHG